MPISLLFRRLWNLQSTLEIASTGEQGQRDRAHELVGEIKRNIVSLPKT